MEEECGNQQSCRDILLEGLRFNPYSENLFIKAIKLEEKLQNFENIRKMIYKIQNDKVSIDKKWKILIEGALFEGRCGNKDQCR